MVLCSDTSTIAGQLFNITLAIVGPNLSVNETAELFAKLAISGYDGGIAGWYQKYKYLFWRPITALRSFLFFPAFNVVYNHLSSVCSLAILFRKIYTSVELCKRDGLKTGWDIIVYLKSTTF
jgi:hypothetical protein